MDKEKAYVFGETKGFENSLQRKNNNAFPIEKQSFFQFPTTSPKTKHLGVIRCFDCHQRQLLEGYRFATIPPFNLVPICERCRKKRKAEIINNQFKRRQK
jgi:hypothetical protein